MKYPVSTFSWQGTDVTNTWIKTTEVENYSPITQAYAVIFNDKNEILIGREKGKGKWCLPGGHPEDGESLVETLCREVDEEVDVEIDNVKPLGVIKVEFEDAPNKPIYQSRFIAKLKKLLPQTPDPANNNIWERKFVPAKDINEYVKWGETGKAMFKDAIELSGH